MREERADGLALGVGQHGKEVKDSGPSRGW